MHYSDYFKILIYSVLNAKNYRNVGLPCYPLAFPFRPARGTKFSNNLIKKSVAFFRHYRSFKVMGFLCKWKTRFVPKWFVLELNSIILTESHFLNVSFQK